MDFAGIYGQVDTTERLDAEEGFGDTSHLEDWITHRASGRVTPAPFEGSAGSSLNKKRRGSANEEPQGLQLLLTPDGGSRAALIHSAPHGGQHGDTTRTGGPVLG